MKKVILASLFVCFVAFGKSFAQTSAAQSETKETPAATAVAPVENPAAADAAAPAPAAKKSCCSSGKKAGKSCCASKSEASKKECSHSHDKAEGKTEKDEKNDTTHE